MHRVHSVDYTLTNPPGDVWLVGGASNSGGAVLRQFFSDARMRELTPRLDPGRPTGLGYYPLPQVGPGGMYSRCSAVAHARASWGTGSWAARWWLHMSVGGSFHKLRQDVVRACSSAAELKSSPVVSASSRLCSARPARSPRHGRPRAHATAQPLRMSTLPPWWGLRKLHLATLTRHPHTLAQGSRTSWHTAPCARLTRPGTFWCALLLQGSKGERFPVADPELLPRMEPRPEDDAMFFQGAWACGCGYHTGIYIATVWFFLPCADFSRVDQVWAGTVWWQSQLAWARSVTGTCSCTGVVFALVWRLPGSPVIPPNSCLNRSFMHGVNPLCGPAPHTVHCPLAPHAHPLRRAAGGHSGHRGASLPPPVGHGRIAAQRGGGV